MSEVRVRIALRGTRLEFRGSRAFFERSIAPLIDALHDTAGGEVDVAAPPSTRQWTPASGERFASFAAQVGPRAETVEQRIMAFAFYLWNYEKREAFGREDVEGFFGTVQEPVPEDLDAQLERLTQTKRFLETAGDDAAWGLTTKGVNYVKNRLLG